MKGVTMNNKITALIMYGGYAACFRLFRAERLG